MFISLKISFQYLRAHRNTKRDQTMFLKNTSKIKEFRWGVRLMGWLFWLWREETRSMAKTSLFQDIHLEAESLRSFKRGRS